MEVGISSEEQGILVAIGESETRIRDDIAANLDKMSAEMLVLQRYLAAMVADSHQITPSSSHHSRAAFLRDKKSHTVTFRDASPHDGSPPHLQKQGSRSSNLLASAPNGGTAASTGSAGAHSGSPHEEGMETTSFGKSTSVVQGRWEGWPSDLFLREEFNLSSEEENIAKLRTFAVSSAERCLSGKVSSGNQSERPTSLLQRIAFARVLHPTSRHQIVFDVMCMIVIFLQVIYLPFALVWTEVVQDIDNYVLLGTALFWFMDMCLRFVTGYNNSDGEVELQLTYVVCHYLRTWFAPDFLCVAVDMANYISAIAFTQHNTSASRIVYIIKIQRILRALLMVRMLRVAKLVYCYMESQLSATWLFVLRTWQFATIILLLAHVVACVWYGMGRYANAGEHGSRWIETIVPGTEDQYRIQDTDVVYQYMTSYHWSLAQITLGGLDINPTNSWERSVAIACNFFGLFFGGMVVSILSTTLMELRENNHDKEVKMQKLREYLLQHGMGIGIRLRVVRQVNERMKQKGKTLVEKDVLALQVVSVTLVRELRYHLYFNLLRTHPLLHSWTLLQDDGISLRQVCSEGVTMRVLLPDDELFVAGSLSKSAYMLKEGSVVYTQRASDCPVCEEQSEVLREAAWISEATWWCHWYHVGTAAACRTCTLVCVTPEAVLESMQSDPVIAAITIEYGIRFHSYIIGAQDCPVTDANVQYADFNGLLCTMPKEVHVILGMAALQQGVASGQHWRLERGGGIDLLKQEVVEGRSLLMMDFNGVLHRRVAATSLQLENRDGDTSSRFTQIAAFDFDSMEWKPNLQLPGVTQTDGEGPEEAMQRIMVDRLGLSPTAISVSKWIQNVETHSSKHYGVGTHYVKTTGVAHLESHVIVKAQLQQYCHYANLQDLTTAFSKKLTTGTFGSGRAGTFGSRTGTLGTVGTLNFGGTGQSSTRLGQSQKLKSYSTQEELSAHLSQIDRVYLIRSQTPSLYLWLSKPDFKRLRAHETALGTLIADLVAKLDKDHGLLSAIASESEKYSSGGREVSIRSTSQGFELGDIQPNDSDRFVGARHDRIIGETILSGSGASPSSPRGDDSNDDNLAGDSGSAPSPRMPESKRTQPQSQEPPWSLVDSMIAHGRTSQNRRRL